MNAQLKTLGVEDIAAILHKSKETIQEDARRKPQCLPPRLVIPGSSRLLWLESDVIEWIESCKENPPSKGGRPRKRPELS